jgi:hypothetical protein|tara:strand:- start:39 stop:377 length:339 start_codon:yes stop_codon:yes gene_type:complete
MNKLETKKVLETIEMLKQTLENSNKEHKVSMKVVSVRQWNTNRGVGYDAKVKGSDGEKYGSIMNDGDGGATYFSVNHDSKKTWRDFSDYDEWDLVDLVTNYDIQELEKLLQN